MTSCRACGNAIVALLRRGWSLAKIGQAFGLDAAGVQTTLAAHRKRSAREAAVVRCRCGRRGPDGLCRQCRAAWARFVAYEQWRQGATFAAIGRTAGRSGQTAGQKIKRHIRNMAYRHAYVATRSSEPWARRLRAAGALVADGALEIFDGTVLLSPDENDP